ncbi:MAG: phosphoribosylamine--glycine ligase [Desulfurivibrionaceae bacterium]|nr:phosphoribosylamine--glycine ligase [Desulfobulbales bacterium]MDT8335178.1 phosphoribosylamine--glycine ligase [Desulfurivibrionaceae bacterium]
MKVLVIGSGGREHALVWKIARSPLVEKIFCAPGNAGIGQLAECVDIAAGDIDKLVDFAGAEGIDLTVVGPEVPLTMGVVDRFREKGLRIFGPTGKAAALEGSKVFAKELLKKYGIPSAAYEVFTEREQAVAYIKKTAAPLVVKADGLAAGKGVVVARSEAEAVAAVDLIMAEKAFGAAGARVVIEEFLTGEEASFLAFTDGKTILPLPSSQDHKAVGDGDQGPNTGGMGAYSPAPVVTDKIHAEVMEKVMRKTVQAMAVEGCPYEGILYAGLMIDNDEVKVLEFNCRFGDPEAQPLLMRLQSDLVEIMEAVIDGRLAEIDLRIDPRPAVCVVMASGGYPAGYDTGFEISGLAEAAAVDGVEVFHAGTALRDDRIVNAGGRVLGITAIGDDLSTAISLAYQGVEKISWPGCFHRSDIGRKALRRGAGHPLVGIVMGSDSDLAVMERSARLLKKMGIPFEITVASAHRTPERATAYSATARQRGLKVIIAAAGMAAHLAGVLAAHTTLPVIGVPIDASALNGLDALLSTVQMPPGVPVATMGIGKPGATNAAILAAQIIGVSDEKVALTLAELKKDMAAQVEAKAAKISASDYS